MALSSLHTYNYPENWLCCRCFLWVFWEFSRMPEERFWWIYLLAQIYQFYSSVENSITCFSIFREGPLLLSQPAGCNATYKQTPNYISTNVLWKLQNIFSKSCLVKFLFSKLSAQKLQPSFLRLFKIQEIHKIASIVTFFFVEGGSNGFTAKQLLYPAFRKNLRKIKSVL